MAIADLISLKGIWSTLFMTCLVFGFAPGAVLRLSVLWLPKDDPRRRELIGELYAMKRWERPVWVFQQLETILFEGLSLRIQQSRERKRSKAAKEESSPELDQGGEVSPVEIKHLPPDVALRNAEQGWAERLLLFRRSPSEVEGHLNAKAAALFDEIADEVGARASLWSEDSRWSRQPIPSPKNIED